MTFDTKGSNGYLNIWYEICYFLIGLWMNIIPRVSYSRTRPMRSFLYMFFIHSSLSFVIVISNVGSLTTFQNRRPHLNSLTGFESSHIWKYNHTHALYLARLTMESGWRKLPNVGWTLITLLNFAIYDDFYLFRKNTVLPALPVSYFGFQL